jgi:2-iminobutanoate/2-iminopropanoate deaminase
MEVIIMRYAKALILIALITGGLLLMGYDEEALFNQPVPKREVIKTPGTHPAGLPFNPGIKVGNMLFVSGTIGSDPKTQEVVSDNIEEQTRQTMENLKTILNQGGMDFSDVVRATVYLTDLNDYVGMNKVYSSYFKNIEPPARACIQVAKLVKKAKVEISMIAIKTE